MLNINEVKYEVEVFFNETKRDLLCSQAEMLAFVNSGLKILVTDPNTGEILFDSETPEFNAEHAMKLIKEVKQDVNQRYTDITNMILSDIAEELGILDDLDHQPTEFDIITEIRSLMSENRNNRIREIIIEKAPIYPALDEIGLSKRAYICLTKYGNIHTVGKLVEQTESDLMKIRNLGYKTRKEIMRRLHSMNLHLKNEELDLPDEPEPCRQCSNSYWNWQEMKWCCCKGGTPENCITEYDNSFDDLEDC